MANELSTSVEGLDESTLSALITSGDCSKLTEKQRAAYFVLRCNRAGLDPATTPLQFINLGGKLVLYALKAATDQLCSNRKISVEVRSQETVGDLRVVTARASTADGRFVDEVGACNIKGQGGDNLANTLMKTVTKAKRRAVLSFCGLGLLDETEVQPLTKEEKNTKKEAEKAAYDARVKARMDEANRFFGKEDQHKLPVEVTATVSKPIEAISQQELDDSSIPF